MKRIKLSFRVKRPILACGADMKGAFALAKGGTAYLFDGFGDLADVDNFTRYEKAVKQAARKLKIRPQAVACDLHPGYFSTQFAQEFCTGYRIKMQPVPRRGQVADTPCTWYKVQHHEAHCAGAFIDNAIKGEALCAAFDGTGYGSDGNMWGGEFFVGSPKKFKRVGHLAYIPIPGGDMAVREPWRMAASYLYAASGRADLFNRKRWVVLKMMIDKKINCPLTSSMGRLFDAVGSLVLGREKAAYEAQLPIELERIASRGENRGYDFEIKRKGGLLIIDMSKMIKNIVRDIAKKEKKCVISAKFHNTIARMVFRIANMLKIKNIILTGGVFQNKFLSKKTRDALQPGGFNVYTHSGIQTNDSGVPIGQIAIASARHSCA